MKEILLAACATLFIYDGDNVRCDGITYRLTKHNAPEIKGQCVAEIWLAYQSRDILRQLVKEPTATLIEVKCTGSNFGRHCADLEIKGSSVSPVMVRAKLAEPYVCGAKTCPKRTNWCRR